MLNHDFITKGAFLWEDQDLDLCYKIIQITVHEKNDVSDELSENSKRYANLRLCTWVSELFPEWFVLFHYYFVFIAEFVERLPTDFPVNI